jgi:flagellar L-ring protein precursor FlgH
VHKTAHSHLRIHHGLTVLIVVSSSLLLGCNSVPTRDPEFAAVRPQVTQPLPASAGAIYQAGHGLVLFEDMRARRVGDILSVRLNESTNASKSAGTTVDRTSSTSVTNPTIFGTSLRFGLPGALPLAARENLSLESALNSTSAFDGEGESNQSNSLTGTIAVTVAEVLPNGNLVVQGEKLFSLNQGHEHIRISGMVRSVDINPDNTIDSTKVANAKIIYAGEGPVAESNVMGWLARFFISAIMPF